MKRKNKKMLICQQKNNFYCEKERKNNNNEDNDDYQKRQQQEMQLNISDNIFARSRECGSIKKKISLLSETKKMRKSNFPQFLSIFLLLFLTKIEIFVFASELTSSSIDNIFHNNTNFDEPRIFGHFQGRLKRMFVQIIKKNS